MSSGICSECGAEAWEPYEPATPRVPGLVVRPLRQGPPADVRRFECPLSEALGGVEIGRTILVSGKPGVGKSTEVAALASRIAPVLRGVVYWLDREMEEAQVFELFQRSGSPTDRVRRVAPSFDGEASGTWRDALRAVGEDAAVIVVDSLQRWAARDVEQTELLETLKRGKVTALVVSHTNKAGQAAGRMGNQHDVDAEVMVKKRKFVSSKCRWTPTPRVTARQPFVQAETSSKNAASSSKA